MSNETISRLVGTFVGAAMIVAGLAALSGRTLEGQQALASLAVGSPVAALHASETVNVISGN